ncbi:MAG: chloride channel protein [Candidatus Azobacteroides pseudotrichonymphae]|jgi:CIC family chloride channel protein|nr:MAG: chloride channel protein [Candidatus Azobacteroides pseudotrichonymphae]
MSVKNIFAYVLHWHWREKYIKEPHFILILSFITGILTAFAGVLLKKIICLIQYFLKNEIYTTYNEYSYLVCPAIGILFSGLFVKFIAKNDIGHGITKILYAISQRKSRLKMHNLWTSLIASSVTIGFGGSVGAEAPSVITGSAIGSNLGRLFKMDQKTLMLLISCGAAGSIAGVFKAPIAGLLFTIEVLMLDLTTVSVLPLLISSVTAASISYIFTGSEAMFKYNQTVAHDIKNIPYVLLLGVTCGLITVYFVRVLIWIESIFNRLKNYWQRFALGAVILNVLVFLFPPLYGEGYDIIDDLINNQYDQILNNTFVSGMNISGVSVLFFMLVIFTKVFATGATTGGGGCGGIFAPSLFLGCTIGFIFSHLLNLLGGNNFLPENNFSLIGMAGMMSAILHAPLTAIFLIAELTGGFGLFLPLMIVSSSAYFTILLFEKYSIHSIRLANEGKLLTHDKDHAVLNFLCVNTLIETDFQTIYPEMTLGDMVKVIAQSNRSVYPVIDSNGILQGVVLWDNIRNIMFRPELYERFNVEKFMISSLTKIRNDMSMDEIMYLFEDSKAWNLPVIDKEKHYIGMISKSKIFSAYRDVLQKNFAED